MNTKDLSPDLPTTAQATLEFSDNRLLIDLCGEYDKNLAQLEAAAEVQIIRRGNRLVIMGDADARTAAIEVLGTLYARLEAGRPVEPADIDRELRMGLTPRKTAEEDGDQIEMFKNDQIEIKTRKKLVEPRTDAQKAYVKSLFDNELAFGIGPAGTGKTYLAVAVGVSMFIGGHVDKIILSRPAVEAGEKLGYLPGDMKDKVDPYMQPLYDALNDFLPAKQLTKLLEDKRIEIAPLAFMRGRTLSNALVVLDAAHNATTMQMKMFLTRIGFGSHAVLTGAASQLALPPGTNSGLVHAIEVLDGIKEIGFTYFIAQDVVRHTLVQRIVEAYDSFDEANSDIPNHNLAPGK